MLAQHSEMMLALSTELGATYTQSDFKKWTVGTRFVIPFFTLPLVLVTVIANFMPISFYELPIEYTGTLALFGACFANIAASYLVDYFLVTEAVSGMGYSSADELY